LRVAVMLRGHDISSPVDADRYAIVDLDKKVLLGENQIRSRGDGLSKLVEVALEGLKHGATGIVIARIGLEGFKALEELGIRVFRGEGKLEKIIATGQISGLGVESIDRGCRCCSLRGSHR